MANVEIPDDIRGAAHRQVEQQGLKGRVDVTIIDATTVGLQNITWPIWTKVDAPKNTDWFFSKKPLSDGK